ncbi:MAG: protein phosphatase 2C domain-containing protein, partial [Muribaculaceae bacterium]|nr:protein phosphatase 2C domain-containing protein [Muribaculaceae bacterium]
MNRKQRIMKRNNISPRMADTARAIERAMIRAGVPASDKEQFLDWTVGSLWDTFRNERMNKRIMIETEMRQKGLRLPNGTVKKEYRAFFRLPVDEISDVELEGADELGLIFAMSENGDCSVSGRPVRSGDFVLKLRYRTVPGEPVSELPIPVAFNPSPRDLWKSVPTDQGIKYYKPDSDSSFIEARYDAAGEMGRRMIAASMRGRSHAQEGNARDDDFRLYRCDDSDWYILAVADGAGSAAYSRKGSEVACDTVVEYCRQCLEDNPEFESAVREFGADSGSEEKRQVLSRKVIDIIYTAAIKAHQAIHRQADSEGLRLKDFATTLMFAVCKRYDFGWFFASFWVGDGAICILDADRRSIRLLGTPDEGEFSG